MQWLNDNAVWLGSLGAIAGVAGLVWAIYTHFSNRRQSSSGAGVSVSAEGGSVAAGKIEGSSININSRNKGSPDG